MTPNPHRAAFSTSPSDQPKSTKRGRMLSLVCGFSLMLVIVVVGTAWTVRYALILNELPSKATTRVVSAISRLPEIVVKSLTEIHWIFSDDPEPLLFSRSVTEKSSWIRKFPSKDDNGYLLFAGVSKEKKAPAIELIRIADGHTVARWSPDVRLIEANLSSAGRNIASQIRSNMPLHPLLLPDGDVVFIWGTGLVRMQLCKNEPKWVIEESLHHSIDLDSHGDLWMPGIAKDGLEKYPWLKSHVINDGISKISSNGKLISSTSFSQILINNNLKTILFGISTEADVLHINQIKVAKKTSKFWEIGDLLISARGRSTVFLYRPSTKKIIWYQTGPWMNQHSVDFLGDHRISIFDNNVIAARDEHAFMTAADVNGVQIYDFVTNTVSQPYSDLLAVAMPRTITQGRAQILDDGGLFIEETESGRHLRFTKDALLWSRINDYDGNRIGAVSWSRYLDAKEAATPLQAIRSLNCFPAIAK